MSEEPKIQTLKNQKIRSHGKAITTKAFLTVNQNNSPSPILQKPPVSPVNKVITKTPASTWGFCFIIYLRFMQFNQVIGQQDVKQHLIEMVQHNRLSHALLFLGKEGSGALPMAIAFAQYLVCAKANPKPAAGGGLFELAPPPAPIAPAMTDSCNACPACLQASKLAHPDIHFSYPVIPKKSGDKPISTDYIVEWREFLSQYPYGNVYDWLQFIGAENKQGNITASECSDIIRKLSLKSFESGLKILILWMPEYLGNEGNKLLKLIEEPPPDTLFILVAENESLVLPTIISRTQLVKVPSLDAPDLINGLMTRAGLGEEQAKQIALMAEGNYREALQLSKHAEEDWQSLLREWLNAILKGGPVSQVKWIDEVSKLGRERQKQFLRYFNHLLEQAIRLQVIGGQNLHLPANEQDFAMRLNKIAGFAEQEAIVAELDKATYYIERNANAKMLFHALTIKLYHIISESKTAQII